MEELIEKIKEYKLSLSVLVWVWSWVDFSS